MLNSTRQPLKSHSRSMWLPSVSRFAVFATHKWADERIDTGHRRQFLVTLGSKRYSLDGWMNGS